MTTPVVSRKRSRSSQTILATILALFVGLCLPALRASTHIAHADTGAPGHDTLQVLADPGLAPTALPGSIIQEFYVPMPEAQIRQAFLRLASNTGTTIESVISIVVPVAGTAVVFDHWEDGYEVDLNNPVQPTTLIWGDGDNANGSAPGFANDPTGLPAGDVIPLRNLVELPRSGATIRFDGRDRVGATQAVVMSRSAWATTPGSVLADATEVPSTADYGAAFVMPIGEDVIFPTPLTASMFELTALFVQAAENGTQVQIDVDGSGPAAPTTVTLNRGESYYLNGGVKKGATVTASKPVQVQLLTGDIGANYESRWYTIPPTAVWTSEYYSPVGTATDGDDTYIFLHNPNAAAITVNHTTRVGSGSFTIPAGDTYRFLMPQNSGARFVNAGGQPFFGVGAVGAEPTQNNVHDWGFSLVPTLNLTTELVVGWGPGTADQPPAANGSPTWVTAAQPTTIYVDYNGDRLGPHTDPNGNKYDVAYTVSALEITRIYEPDRDQTALRIYTLDGTLITGAWGQDPATAGAGNPFLDVGTAIPSFPIPVLRKTVTLKTDNAPAGLSVGDVMEYTIVLQNKGLVALSAVTISDELPVGMTYVPNSTTRDGISVSDSASGTPFPIDGSGITVPILLRGADTQIKYLITIAQAGPLKNAAGTNLPGVDTELTITIPDAAPTPCTIRFTNAAGVETDYQPGDGIYVTCTDPDANTDTGTAQSFSVAVQNSANGDIETLLLTETGTSTGVFRNATALPSSTTAGGLVEDGTLLAVAGHTISVSYTDPINGETCTDTAVFFAPGALKQLYLSDPGQALDRVDPVATGDATSAQTAVMGASGSSTVSFNTPGTQTWTVPAGVTSITVQSWGGGGAGGGSTNAGSGVARGGAGGGGGAYASSTLSVTPGQTLTVVVPGAAAGVSGATGSSGNPAFVGPDGNPGNAYVRAAGGSGGTGNTSGGTPAGGAGGTVANSVGTTRTAGANGQNGATGFGISSGAGGAGASPGGGAGGAAVTSSGTSANGNSGTTPGGGGSGSRTSQNTGNRTGGDGAAGQVTITYTAPSSVAFTQTPAFCRPFTLPAGGQVAVRSYYTLVSGAIGPAISANLTYGANTFFTDNTATAGSDANGTYLEWSGALGSEVTIPSGSAVVLDVTNGLAAGNSFRLDYDSAAKPSKITLPTTTVISVDSLAVYDAPYPGGNVVTAPVNGQILYVRSTVSDPFGAYDITAMQVAIDGPGTADDITANLTGANVVAGTACAKTYEYEWRTGATSGAFSVAVTAREGFENTVTDRRSTTVTLSRLDLGTPSTAEFTNGNNGSGTDTYAGNQNVCVRVTDIDQNTDPNVAETVTAVITSSSGDSETVTLTETGVNTGVFTACVTASTTTGSGSNNGTLSAPLGSALSVTYVDPNDSTDTSSDNAAVPAAPGVPGVAVVKTLLAPADGQIVIGETAQFRLRVTNTGNTTLNTVQVVDTFPSASLSYVSASPTPNNTSPAGTLTWNNVGPLSAGQSVDILVTFTGLAAADPATNTVNVTTGTGGPTAADTEPVVVTRSGVSVSKTRTTPAGGAVNLGDNQSFQIVVQNTGATAITTLPLEDTFSAACWQYVSAAPAPDSTFAGGLLWDDITGAGSLAPGNAITIDVTLKAAGGCNPANNTAAVNFAVDQYGDPVPPAESVVGVETLAATISGFVYADGGNLAFGADDGPLSGVVVRLFKDGVLVGVTTTNAAGYYEFLNLGPGNYVVVQEDLPGAFSLSDVQGAPRDNQVAVAVTTPTAYPNNNFLDTDRRLDLGDHADTYGTLIGVGAMGAVHILQPDLDNSGRPNTLNGAPAVWLGALVDAETDGRPTTTATGDNSDGLNDEDGMRQPSWNVGAAQLQFQVAVSASGAVSGLYLGVWIDWNKNGVFETATFSNGGEMYLLPVNLGTNNLEVPGPSGFNGDSALEFRLRLYAGDPGTPSPTGIALNGEVEDHVFGLSPLAITLSDFYAEQTGETVQLVWETNSELNNRGFHLWRGVSADAPDRRLNSALIPSQSQGSPGGFFYTWTDTAELVPGATYFYWLEDIDVNGVVTRHGPVSVFYTGAPTAVGLRSVEAGATSVVVIAAAVAVALAGSYLALRRRAA